MGASMLALTSIGSAALLYQYQANTDPNTQGWTDPASNVGITPGAIIDSGTPAWSVDDQSTTFGATYAVTPTTSDISLTTSQDWKLSVTLRVTQKSDSPAGAIIALYRDGTKSYQMHFGSDPSANPIVVLSDGVGPTSGLSYTVPGSIGYNTYDLIYSQSAGSASLYVNGSPTPSLTNYSGFAFTTKNLAWGSGSSADTGHGNFSAVSLSTVPEPSTYAMLCLGATAFFVGRHRRKQGLGVL